MRNRRGLIIGGSIAGLVVLLQLIGSLGNGGDNKSTTVTVTAQAAPAPALLAPPPEEPVYVPPPVAPADALPPSSAYYGNCSQARAAGAAPLHVGEPGYRLGLDRDGDGVACE
jgi:hypothetical protein